MKTRTRMRTFVLMLALLTFTFSLSAIELHKGTKELNEALEKNAESQKKLPVIIVMKDQVDSNKLYESVKSLPKKERREVTMSTLMEHSQSSQRGIKKFLTQLKNENEVERLRFLWISNVIGLNASVSSLKQLDLRDDVARIEYDPEVKVIDEPIVGGESQDRSYTDRETGEERAIAWNLDYMDVPAVWEKGYLGGGVLVAVLDTGVNYNHHDIKNQMWQHPDYPNHGLDFGEDDDDPIDHYDHGTHCAGTIAGDGTSGTQTGIAPQSTIMALKTTYDQGGSQQIFVWNALEFALEHDVDVLSMSLGWNQYLNPDRKTWRDIMVNILSVGVPASLSAGNERKDAQDPVPLNIRTPADCPSAWLHPDQIEIGGVSSVLAIGASDSSGNIADFSSIGPSTWQTVDTYNDYPYDPGIGLIKPDITAPGVGINSIALNNTGYTLKSGTSMSCPNASGVITLMVSKNHSITPEEISEILQKTARPVNGKKDNVFGTGIINALDAINAMSDEFPPNPAYKPFPMDFATLVELTPELRWKNGGAAEVFYVSFGTDNPPTNILLEEKTDYSGYKIIEHLEPLTTYYWSVTSENSFGTTESKIWNFTTGLKVNEGFETGDFSNYKWEFTTTGSGESEWSISEDTPYRGDYSARSAVVGHNATTRMFVTLDILEPGNITYYHKISSEKGYDLARFYVDNTLMGEWSGDIDWEQVSFPVEAGLKTFRWMYTKDSMGSFEEDCMWVDEIIFPPHPAKPVKHSPKDILCTPNFENIRISWDIDINEDINPIQFKLMGFDIYRKLTDEDEYIKLNESLINENEFIDVFTEASEYSYYLTATYRDMGVLVVSEPSEIVQVVIHPAPQAPKINPPEGEYNFEVEITIESDEVEGDYIFYTLDGTSPTTEAESYTEPFILSEDRVVKARVYKEGYMPGEIATSSYTITTTGIEEELLPTVTGIKAYPNPLYKDSSASRSSDTLQIEYNIANETKLTTITIYNIKGQTVNTFIGDSSKGFHRFEWDLTNFNKAKVGTGFYFVQLKTDNELVNTRITILK